MTRSGGNDRAQWFPGGETQAVAGLETLRAAEQKPVSYARSTGSVWTGMPAPRFLLIREVVEDCAPPGSVPREDYLTPDRLR